MKGSTDISYRDLKKNIDKHSDYWSREGFFFEAGLKEHSDNQEKN